MDNSYKAANDAVINFITESVKNSVEFNQKIWQEQMTLYKTFASMVPGLDKIFPNM